MLKIKFKEESHRETWENLHLLNLSRPRQKTKSPKRKARKKTKAKYVGFKDIPVGRFLYVYAPIYYHLLLNYSRLPGRGIRGKVKPEVIEELAINSDNPAFRSIRFRKALIDYRRFGLRKVSKMSWNAKDALYFARHSYAIHCCMDELE